MFSSRTGANFRKHIDPVFYKAGRSEKPAGYWEVVQGVEQKFRCYRIEGLEADDLLGIAGTDLERWGQAVVVSIDKDMETIPGLIFNPSKDRRPRQVSTAQADYRWMTQTLTGDQCDGYKGCPKIGPVKAERILAQHAGGLGSMWRAVVETFEAADLTHDDALLQARLSRILRYVDYDRANKEVRLWHLTKPSVLKLADVSSTPVTDVTRPTASPAVQPSVPPANTTARPVSPAPAAATAGRTRRARAGRRSTSTS